MIKVQIKKLLESVLGRGLDIWQKTNGRYDIAEYYQEKRLCKEFEVTVVKQA